MDAHRGDPDEKIFPMGTVFHAHTHDQDERRPAVVLEEVGVSGGGKLWKSAHRFCPLRRVDDVVVPAHLASICGDVIEELKLGHLPEEVTSNRDMILLLGLWFERFDASCGGFVPDAYHTWLHDGDAVDLVNS